MGVGLVERWHLAGWRTKIQARSKLPELICRLIKETTEEAEEVVFPRDEGVDTGGFDGTVKGSSRSVWMPAGPSVWELSTKESPGKKADDDYTDRTADPLGWDMAKSSYVQVSLRPWPKRGPWATDRSAEGQWREVRALGLDDIVAWLNEAPETELWLADLLNLHPSELTRGRRWWEDRVDRTDGIYGESVILAGRATCKEEFVDQLEGDKGSVTVEAESIEAALEFIAAAANGPLGSEDTGSLLDRMVFVHGPNAWHRLHGESGRSLVLVACDPGLAELTPDDVHTSVFPVQESGGSFSARRTRDGSRDCVAVPRLDGRLDAGALDTGEARACGINNPEARRLGVVGGRSADALRRQLSVSPAIRIPAWATVDSQAGICVVRAKTAALLAGDWSGVRSESAAGRADRDVVASLAGGDLDYETVQLTLQPFSVGPDPMLRYDGSTWRLVAPREAWQLSAPSLVTEDVLERFFDVAAEVLSERDPLGGLDTDDRIVGQLRGVGYRYSADLRYGIARSLAMLSAHGGELVLPAGIDPAHRMRRLVADLLEPNGAERSVAHRVRRLADLSDVLSLLAEAAPTEVVDALEETLRQPDDASAALFADAEHAQHPWAELSPHVAVLGAVERLVWVPGRLDDVAEILRRLEVLDPGGYLAQRPSGSFADIFDEVAP